VLPLMLANTIAYVLARRYRATPIYEALLLQDGVVLPRVAARGHSLDHLSVANAMTSEVVSVSARASAGEAQAAIAGRGFQLVPAVDEKGRYAGVVTLAALWAAPPASPIAAMLQRAETVLADAPLTRAMVRMNDKATRQLVVLDEKTASRVVGVLTMTDLIRTHARAVGAEAPRKTDGLAAEPLETITARQLAKPAPAVAASASVAQLIDALAQSPSASVVVQGAEGKSSGVVLLEHLADFVRDERLRRMLVAADVVRAAPLVAPDAPLAELVAACAASDAPALLVAGEGQPESVITRSAVGEVLIGWYARFSS
jgi:CBS domain-containing protein